MAGLRFRRLVDEDQTASVRVLDAWEDVCVEARLDCWSHYFLYPCILLAGDEAHFESQSPLLNSAL